MKLVTMMRKVREILVWEFRQIENVARGQNKFFQEQKMVKWKVKNDFVRSDIYKESVLKQ